METKILPPARQPDVVARPDLVGRLRGELDRSEPELLAELHGRACTWHRTH